MKYIFTILLLVCFSASSFSQVKSESGKLKIADFKFDSIFGSTSVDKNAVYCLLASGYFRSVHSENLDSLIKNWIDTHKNAVVIPVSSIGPMIQNMKDSRMVYCWVVQGNDTLNTHIIRNGGYAGGTMIRPRSDKEMKELGLEPRGDESNVKILTDKDEYNAFMEKVKVAESYAREKNLGIWKEIEKD